MAELDDDLNALKVQFYAISGVFGFLIIVLAAVVIDLAIKVRKLRKGEDYEDEDEEVEDTPRQPPPPPPVNSEFSFPKPNASKNWRDTDTEIRKQNDQQEFNVPKPALSKSWKGYPGERDRNQPNRNFGNDFRQEDDMSNMSYDGRKSPTFASPSNAFRNPFSMNNNLEPNYNYRGNNNRSDRPNDRPPKPPSAPRMPPNSGNNFGHGNDNFGFKRDFQRNNNYY